MVMMRELLQMDLQEQQQVFTLQVVNLTEEKMLSHTLENQLAVLTVNKLVSTKVVVVPESNQSC